ncbi:MAG: ribose-phosphate pyrophosphokinase [Candidatus Pacebacteria bacterium]|nr:ribose-phosphate pyrophosphokinase [Candidatus Paceibacterota bacterium]
MTDRMLFHGTHDLVLAEKVASIIGCELGRLEITSFKDTEQRVRVLDDVGDKVVFVLLTVATPVNDRIIELCLIADALRGADAKKIIAVLPYLGYMRQDKAHREGEAVSARVIARIIESAGYDKVITLDMHSDASAGFFNIPVNHLFSFNLFADVIAKEHREPVIVAPDAGGTKRAQRFATLLNAPMILLEKTRSLEKVHVVEHMKLIGSSDKKEAVIIDDLVTSGQTLAKAAKALKEEGAPRVVACVTHPVFIDGTKANLADSDLDAIYVTDTIPIPDAYMFPKLHVVSVASLLAEAIKKTR